MIRNIKGYKSLRNGALFSLFSFINKGFGFFLLMVLANYITPEEYGYLSLFTTIVMLLGYFKAMSTEGYLSIAYFSEGESGIRNSLSCIFFTSAIFMILAFVVWLMFGNLLTEQLHLSRKILLTALFVSFFTLYTNVNLDYYRIRERVKVYGFLSCSNATLNFVISILFVKYLSMGWEGRVSAQFLCFTLYGIIGLFCFFKNSYIGIPNRGYWKKMLIWGIPLIPHLATTFMRQGCDTYIINHFHSIKDVGLFNFALTLTNVITMIGVGFNQSNSVDIFKVLGNKDLSTSEKSSKLRRQKKVILMVYIGASLITVTLCLLLVPFILPRYKASMPYFAVLAMYGFAFCLYLLYTNFLFYYKKTRVIMYITFASACTHLLLSLCLTRFSLFYTSVTYVITQMLVFVLISYQAKKELRLHNIQI